LILLLRWVRKHDRVHSYDVIAHRSGTIGGDSGRPESQADALATAAVSRGMRWLHFLL
jgi:hypothetical protein